MRRRQTAGQHEKAYSGGDNVAEGAGGFGDTHHCGAPAQGHHLRDVAGIEAVFAAYAEAHRKQTHQEHRQRREENRNEGRRKDEQRAGAEHLQIADAVGQRTKYGRADGNTHEVGATYEPLHGGRQFGMSHYLHQGDDDAHGGGQRRAYQLAKRRCSEHTEVARTQRHGGHHQGRGHGFTCLRTRGAAARGAAA